MHAPASHEQDPLLFPVTEGSMAFVDKTELLQQACSELNLGEYLMPKDVGLWDVISAIVVMDPKLDTGMALPEEEEQKKMLPAFDPDALLTYEQAVRIIIRLLSCELTWLEGASLAQTIYTSRYAQEVGCRAARPGPQESLARNCVWAYTKSLLASSQLVWREMARGNVYEEEDFGTNTFGLSLLADTQALDALVDLDSVFNGVKLAQEELEDDEGEGNDGREGWLRALSSLISLRRNWYGLLRTIIVSSAHDQSRMEKGIRTTRDTLKEVQDQLQALQLMEDEGVDVNFAFDPFIYKRLPAQAPPRPTELLSPKKALSFLSDTLNGLEMTAPFGEIKDPQELVVRGLDGRAYMEGIFGFMDRMGFVINYAYITPTLPALCRSVFLTMLTGGDPMRGISMSRTTHMHALLTDFAGLPRGISFSDLASSKDKDNKQIGSVPQSNNGLPGPLRSIRPDPIGALLQEMAALHLDTMRIRGQNHGRVRRLNLNMLPEWDALLKSIRILDEVVVENMDGFDSIEACPVSGWALHQTIRMAWEAILMGFDLELYSAEEVPQVYWLSMCLLSTHIEELDALVANLERRSGGRVGKIDRLAREERVELAAMRNTCEALFLATLALQKKGRWPTQEGNVPGALQEEGVRFQARFRHLYGLSNLAVPSWSEYLGVRQDAMKNESSLISKAIDLFCSTSTFLNRSLSQGLKDTIPSSYKAIYENEMSGSHNQTPPKEQYMNYGFLHHPWLLSMGSASS
ncbi:Mak10 subunit, NatC N-terminal acetyltransferase-domain-containing protein [Piptocephalis cylindrospora]|uniref:Mak10 subunit, NatC N-terminal acetyltransferase-domain-containing protein n=1 Tax=Piptocephalis cylindrospora TaxID=1907219 RepID=A0A4P9Y872_9FUNG|nr:Mak10 subunit, NatC N-terminal acetyltransferase-domain-containing protein [Piptocephalis cylindrospora]|eukprot:RKP14511.1 Mak10 subunit, NatC N-terminal acetyltransferase-domain-containing protein [Piptocephalis cylindrospora]